MKLILVHDKMRNPPKNKNTLNLTDNSLSCREKKKKKKNALADWFLQVIFNWRMSKRVLKTKFPRHDASLDEESDLTRGCIDIGKAWEYDEDGAHQAEDGINNNNNNNSRREEGKPKESTVLDGLGEAEVFYRENEN